MFPAPALADRLPWLLQVGSEDRTCKLDPKNKPVIGFERRKIFKLTIFRTTQLFLKMNNHPLIELKRDPRVHLTAEDEHMATNGGLQPFTVDLPATYEWK